MQRQSGPAAADIPERGIDGAQSQTGNRPHGSGMGMEKQVLPDLLHHRRVAPEQFWRQMVADQRHYRRPAGSDRIGVSGTLRSVVGSDPQHRRFLGVKRLNRVTALHLGPEIHLKHLDPDNFRHAAPSSCFLVFDPLIDESDVDRQLISVSRRIFIW
jgi:hypothetical protein